MELTNEMKQLMNREVPVLTAEIKKLYQDLDQRFGLNAAKLEICFGFNEDSLGAYTRNEDEEYFSFSLLFVARCIEHPLSKSDREDLYKHEYAHYMQYHMVIPKEYEWQPGIHGSAWKYCCSLIDAAPTPYYKVGESLLEHDYEAAIKKRIPSKAYESREIYRNDKAYHATQDSIVRYQIGDEILHPKFGKGIIKEAVSKADGVTLSILFGEECRQIDQKWLLKNTRYKQVGDWKK